jgi:uncharacterized protein
MNLPTQKQCFDLWDKYKVPDNIKEHSKSVAKVADAAAILIEEKGVRINKELVNRGALLHDIAKIIAVNKNAEESHAELGVEIAEKENLGREIAEIIRKHYLSGFDNQCTIEELVVNYADKRVTHDKIVPIKERFDYICSHYPRAIQPVKEKKEEFFEFERKYKLDQIDLTE